ncbi:MAG TPA: two-component regulator propeller domain-containing protein [Bacteroidota bacterium]|nr:two-component regulator propeller domain-containing protein [Bacteroidota bacterium]
MRMRISSLSRFCLFAACVCLYTPFLHADHHTKFTNLSVKQGLSQNSVWTILHDKQGFFWFGTDDGLNKYDGYRFLVYRYNKNDSTTFNQNAVRALMQDRHGRIWIGTSLGVSIYDPVTDHFSLIHSEGDGSQALRSKQITSIVEDRSGAIWVGTYTTGLFRIDPAGKTHRHFTALPGNPGTLGSNVITALYVDKAGTLWVGTMGAGIFKYNPSTGTFTAYRNDPKVKHSLPDKTVNSFYEDTKGRFWVGTYAHGIVLFDRTTGSCRPYPSNDEAGPDALTVYAILEDPSGRILYGTFGAGLKILDPETGSTATWKNDIRDIRSLGGNEVLSLCRDEMNNLWIGTYTGGVSKYDANSEHFQVYRNENPHTTLLTDNNIRSLYKDSAGAIWIGTPKGLNIFDPVTGRCEQYQKKPGDPRSFFNNYIREIYRDSKGTMWIGTRGGLETFDRTTKRFSVIAGTDSLSKAAMRSDIRMVLEDHTGLIWIGTAAGLCSYDRTRKHFVVYTSRTGDTSSISSNNVRSLIEDHAGTLWVATYNGGLNKFNRATGTFTRYMHQAGDSSSLSNDNASPIIEDHRGHLWIGTYGGGINKFDPRTGRFTVFTEENGLINNTIFGILADAKGKLWISTYSGISQLDLSTETFRNYTSASGLQSEEFNLNCSFRSKDGSMLFGGHDGFNIFDPDHIRENSCVPNVYITSMSIFNKPVRWDSAMSMKRVIVLPYDENSFSFDFVALNFRKSELNSYRYKLEGFDTEWSPAGFERKASYTNLVPGEYVFRVQGSNNDAVWNTTGASVSIVIRPPFWRTWWAYVIYVIAFAAAAYVITDYVRRRQRTRRFIERQQYERERLEKINLEIGEERILLRTVIDNIPMAVYAKDVNARRVITNSVDLAAINKPEHEVLGRTDLEILPPEIAERSMADDLSVITTGVGIVGREELVVNSAGERRSLLVSKIPWRDKEGAIVGLVGIALDITERKRLEQQLLQSQKLEGVGTLAGGIAHDFNNLLAMVLGSAELLQQRLTDQPDLRRYVDRIIEASERGASISRQLLIFSRPDQAELKPIAVSTAIIELKEMLKHFLPKSILIETAIDAGDDLILGDAGQIHQALLNLALNGSDAMKSTGCLTIRKFAVPAAFMRAQFPTEAAGPCVAVSVSDTGVGMDETTQRRIFDPFFTTKPPGKGTGLGLGIVHGIVKNHNGLIHIDSTPGMGTTVTLYFPAVSGTDIEAVDTHAAPARGTTGTILIADDEPMLREMMAEFLCEAGYAVHSASNGFEALEFFKEHRDIIDLVITDLGMPKMGGEELYRQLRALDRTVKVIVSSGYLDGTTKETLLQMGISHVLIKPFKMHEIRSAVSAVLMHDADGHR